MTQTSDSCRIIKTSALHLEFSLVPSDTEILGAPVGQITEIACTDQQSGAVDFGRFEHWRDELAVRLVSCRLMHDRLNESMLLERGGFRFIEMVYRPLLTAVRQATFPQDDLEISPATDRDLSTIEEIAGSAFKTDRFHLDPCMDHDFADRRYRRWVRTSLQHPSQRLLKISEAGSIVAFFIVERFPDGRCYWHLTAIARAMQRKGLGKRIWRAMIMHHRSEGVERIETTISAHNVAALNLYAGLGYRFQPPAMTFHWHRA
jgi:RimJ/RimL family protein N-acetyltransferase